MLNFLYTVLMGSSNLRIMKIKAERVILVPTFFSLYLHWSLFISQPSKWNLAGCELSLWAALLLLVQALSPS